MPTVGRNRIAMFVISIVIVGGIVGISSINGPYHSTAHGMVDSVACSLSRASCSLSLTNFGNSDGRTNGTGILYFSGFEEKLACDIVYLPAGTTKEITCSLNTFNESAGANFSGMIYLTNGSSSPFTGKMAP
jgi:hypothetical protein